MAPSLSDQIAELISIRDSSVQHLKDERTANDDARALQERENAVLTAETADVAQLRARLAAQEAHQTAGSCMLQRYQQDVARHDAVSAQLEQELELLAKDEKGLLAALAAANQVPLDSQAAAQAAQKSHSQTAQAHQLRSLQAQCAQLSAELRKRAAANGSAKQEISALDQQLAGLQRYTAEAEGAIAATEQQTGELEATIRAQQSKLVALGLASPANQSFSSARAAKYESDVTHLKNSGAQLEQELAAAQQEYSRLKTSLEAIS